MHEGPDSVYLSDKPIELFGSDGPQGTQATEQKSSHRPKMFDRTDGTPYSDAGVFTQMYSVTSSLRLATRCGVELAKKIESPGSRK
jgi:hypothetical protein